MIAIIIIVIKHYVDSNTLLVRITIQTLFFSILPTFGFVIKPYLFSYFHKKQRDLSLEKLLLTVDKKINIFTSEVTNAFALGITGSGKIIILGNELKKYLDEDSLRGILYHEIGHHKNDHLYKMYLYTFIVSFVSSVFITITQHFFRDYVHMSIIVTLNGTFYGVLGYYALIFQKKMEFQADAYAVSIVGSEKYITALKKLNEIKDGQMNKKSTTHPTLSERINHINEKK
jgi:Zn-dependent protease with chaperone function